MSELTITRGFLSPTAAPTLAPISRWKLDSNALDVFGVSHGAFEGNPQLGQDGLEDEGESIGFDGFDDGVIIPHASAYALANWAIHLKIQPDTTPTSGNRVFFGKGSFVVGVISIEQRADGLNAYIGDGVDAFWQGPGGSANGVVPLPNGVACDVLFQGGSGGTELWHRPAGGSWAMVGSNASTVGLTANTEEIAIGVSPYGGARFDGLIDNVAIYNRKLGVGDREQIAAPVSRAHSDPPPVADPPGVFISPTGSDTTGTGTSANPWQTLGKGMANVSAGGQLNLRGGTYRLSSGFTWSKSGSSGGSENRITIASYPGEIAIIDGARSEFQTVGNSQWELFDGPTATYRSASASYTGTFFGSIIIEGRLVTLWRYNLLDWLTSQTYVWQSNGAYYRGPGFCRHTDGRIYIRLQNLSGSRGAGIPSDAESSHPLGDIRNTPPSSGGFDPTTFKINLSNIDDLFTVTASHLKFERIAFEAGDRGVVFNGGVTNVELFRCRMWGQRINYRLNANLSNITVRRCDMDTGVPPHMSWNEVKADDINNPGLKLSFSTCDENQTGILVEENLMRSSFDGMASPRATSSNIRFLHNTCLFMFDDFVQFNGGTLDLEVGWNFICGGGPGYNGGQSDLEARKWFHHNVIDIRRGEFGWRLGMENANGGGTAWRKSHNPFPTHSTGGSDTPAKVYNNTILYRRTISNDGSRIERQGTKTAGFHEAYNNIAWMDVNAHSYVRGVQDAAPNLQFLDYNIMHAAGALDSDMFSDWPGGDYASLAAWLASPSFNGWEAHSKQGDPQLRNLTQGWPTSPGSADYRPSATGIAASGAKQLASTGWPGATNSPYIGAVAPGAGTGLGEVGIPPGTLVGP